MVYVLLVEDEKKTAAMLKELIENQSEYLVVHTCDSIESTVEYLKKNQQKLDLMFLDIQLADGQSFEIFQEIEVEVPVIFCTAYNEYVLKAFKNNGIEYLLKPIREKELGQALKKFERLRASLNKDTSSLNERLSQAFNLEKKFQKSFLVHFRDKMIPIAVDDIAFVMLEDEVVYLFNQKGEKYPIFKKMEEMQKALDDEHFFRINRQMILNRTAIQEIAPYFNRKVIIKLPFSISEKIIVSRLKVTSFMQWVEGA
ncbi:MAG: LytTR family DNA-binding domain-containing protein [Bacteroidota bacterium]